MLKFLVIGAIIVVAVILLARKFGGPRVKPQSTTRTPPIITPDGGATAAEIDGQELDIDQAAMADIRALIASGNKIEAIKRLREATGLGLAEAKEIVESLEKIKK